MYVLEVKWLLYIRVDIFSFRVTYYSKSSNVGMNPHLDLHDPVVDMFPGILHIYWYILSCVVTRPLICYF